MSLLLAFLLLTLAMSGSLLAEVSSDGMVALRYNLIVPDAPTRVNMTVPARADLVIARSGDTPVPVEYDHLTGQLSLPALDRRVEITAYYSRMTEKRGAIWRLELPPQRFETTVALPRRAIPVLIEPRSFRAEVIDGKLHITFEPGTGILIEYTLAPQVATPTPEAPSPLWGALYLAAILTMAALAFLLMRRSRDAHEELDERDRAILRALERGGLSAQEIQQVTGIPKTPLYRRLEKLERMGKIESETRGPTKIYRLKRG